MGGVSQRSLRDFRAIYREHLGFVAHALQRFGTSADLLEDAVQDVFVVAYRRRDDYTGPSTKAWLYGISRRVASNYRRSERRRIQRRDALPNPPAKRMAAEVHEAVHALARYLNGLRPEDRELFILSELEGMTGPEIAHVRGRNVQTIYTRIRKLRTELAVDLDRVDRVRGARPRASAHGWAALTPVLSVGKASAVAAATWTKVLSSGWGLGVGAVTVAAVTVVAWNATGDSGVAAAQVPVAAEHSATPTAGVAQADARRPHRTSPAPALPHVEAVADHQPTSNAPPAPTRRTTTTAPQADPGPATSPEPADTLAEQNAMLRRAADALGVGNPSAALAMTTRHAQQFSASPLADLRAALRIEALCQLGKTTQARGEATLFLRDHADSAVAPRVEKICRAPSYKGLELDTTGP